MKKVNRITLAVLAVSLSSEQIYASTCNTNMSNQSTVANNGSCAPKITTQTNSNAVGQTSNLNAGVTVTNGDTITFDSANTSIGGASSGQNTTYQDILPQTALDLQSLSIGGKQATVSINDPVNGQKVIQVYDSNAFTSKNAITGSSIAPIYTNIDSATGERGAYVNAVFGVVDASQGGGTLDVMYSSYKVYGILGKQNQGLFRAYGTDNVTNTNTSTINVKGSAAYIINDMWSQVPAGTDSQTVSFNYSKFTENPITVNNKTYTVTSVDEYKTFNNDLIALLKTGTITETQYNDYMNSVYTTEQYTQNVATTPIRDGDTLTLAPTAQAIYYATAQELPLISIKMPWLASVHLMIVVII